MRSRAVFMALSVGVLVGALGAASALFAQSRGGSSMPTSGQGPYQIVDTPGSTYLLNSQSGDVWRLSFTEVKGDRYWFGTHVPVQKPASFDEFQRALRKRLGNR